MESRFLKFGVSAAVLALCGLTAAAQPSGVQLVSANAQLTQNVDSKNVTEGQVVAAKLTSNVKNAGAVELPKGTTLIGKVVHVQKSNGSAQLSIVFDQAKLRDGKTVAIKAMLLSVSPADFGDYFVQTGENRSVLPEAACIPADQKIDQTPGLLKGVEMRSDAESDASGVFTSDGRDIDLNAGRSFSCDSSGNGRVADLRTGSEKDAKKRLANKAGS